MGACVGVESSLGVVMATPSWLSSLMTDTVTVCPATVTTDSLGNEVPSLGSPVTEKCLVQPLSSSDSVEEPLSLATHRLLTSPSTVASTDAEVTYNGTKFDVLAPPLSHKHPLFAGHHVTVYLRISGGGV